MQGLRSRAYKQVELTEVGDVEQAPPNAINEGGFAAKMDEAQQMLPSLSFHQKVRLLSGLDMWRLKPVPSLRLPAIWLCDGPHGLRKQVARHATDLVKGRVPATCFPTASALACSWDTELLHEVGVALGRECIANNVSVLLGPGMNIIRTPLGGRSFEYFSEDPLLTGLLAAAMVQGIQSTGVAACPKHFCVNNQETDRWVLDAIVDERTLRELYWKPFKMVVRLANPWTIMAAYNKVNGLYCTENRVLLKRLLRDEWKFQGLVMSDWGATNERWKGIVAGCDLEIPGSKGSHDYDIFESYYGVLLKEEDIDESAARVLSLMLLGKEVGAESVRYSLTELEHHQLAYTAAVKSCVLLKNDGCLLPLKPGTSIAVIGNYAAYPRIQGMGSSQVLPTAIASAFQRFQDHTVQIHGCQGYSDYSDNDALCNALLDEAIDAAKANEVAILFLGLPAGDECEGYDRVDMDLPEEQEILLDKILEVNPKTIVVLTNGSPVTMPWASQVPSIFEAWLSGQAGGTAIADLIFGEESPSGKLAQTFPVKMEDIPAIKWFPGEDRQVQYREALNVGYRYFNSTDKNVLFPFGHGLAYTTFMYSGLKLELIEDTDEEVKVSVSVTISNSGTRAGTEIAQCYVYDCDRSIYRPYHELQAFQKVHLEPQKSKTIHMELDKTAFEIYDVGYRQWHVEAGKFEIQVGASSRDIRVKEIVTLASGQPASTHAKIAHPNKGFPLADLPQSDTEFSAMLGYEIPVPPAPTGLIGYNSMVKDLKTSGLGLRIYNMVWCAMRRDMDDRHDKLQLRVQQNMLDTMPLRGLVVFSRGMLSFDLLDLILSVINGEYAYAKALCMAPAVLVSWLIMKCCDVNTRV